MITLEAIKEKLGFDPMEPPKNDNDDGWSVDDSKPSIWEPLTQEESLFVLEHCFGVSKDFIDRFRNSLGDK